MRVNRFFTGGDHRYVQHRMRSDILISTPGMISIRIMGLSRGVIHIRIMGLSRGVMHIRIMGLSRRISAEGALHTSLGQRPRR